MAEIIAFITILDGLVFKNDGNKRNFKKETSLIKKPLYMMTSWLLSID